MLQKNVIMTKNPYVACIDIWSLYWNTVEKNSSNDRPQTPARISGPIFDATMEIFLVFGFLLFSPARLLFVSARTPRGAHSSAREGTRAAHDRRRVERTRFVEVGATRSKRSKAKAKGEGGHAGTEVTSDPGERQ